MKLKRIHLAILSMVLPVTVFSLGMGDINVNSQLDQPFRAEIPLIDTGGMPLSVISASIASPDNFERAGMDRAGVLSLLKLQVVNNKQGQPVISITSTERITDPWLQLVVDLAWSNGQLYRAYTVLLDPPDYKLPKPIEKPAYKSEHVEPGVIDKPVYAAVVDQTPGVKTSSRKQASYGPTMANEDIWQIAQRYSTSDASLPQIILAIVGTNSDAFTQGNLNGLKQGSRLKIPSAEEVLKVPAGLAAKEVEAQDAAWKNKTEIKHVLLPPYVDGVAGESQFHTTETGLVNYVKPSGAGSSFTNPFQNTVVAPKLAPVADSVPGVVSANQMPAEQKVIPSPITSGADIAKQNELLTTVQSLKTQLHSATELINSIRSENAKVKNELKQLESQTSPLQKTLQEQNAAILNLRKRLQSIDKNTDTIKVDSKFYIENRTSLLFGLPIFAILCGWGLGFLANRKLGKETITEDTSFVQPEAPILADLNETSEKAQSEAVHETDVVSHDTALPQQTVEEETASTEALANEHNAITKTEKSVADVTQDSSSIPVEPAAHTELVLEELSEELKNKERIPPLVHVETDEPDTEEDPDDYLLEFDVDPVIPPHSKKEEPVTTPPAEPDLSGTIDFVLEQDEKVSSDAPLAENIAQPELELHDDMQGIDTEKPVTEDEKLVKSTLALDTLLDLAKTYISMGDEETAKQSLQEVLDFGTKDQQAKAKQLLDSLNR